MKQFVDSKLNPEIREMLLGHKIGLAGAYYRPTEQEMHDEYMKSVNALTINQENRLKMKVEILESKEMSYEQLDSKLNALIHEFKNFKSNKFYNKIGEHPLIGKRIRLSFTKEPYAFLKDGDFGTITEINELKYFTHIGVDWDNGSKLMLIEGKDKFEILD